MKANELCSYLKKKKRRRKKLKQTLDITQLYIVVIISDTTINSINSNSTTVDGILKSSLHF